MTTQIKYLIFKGIEKKEQILFKSFLNLAKNELSYQVVILKDDAGSGDAPDIVIMDEGYEFASLEAALLDLPTICVGDDIGVSRSNYIARPVQWSDFKVALTQLHIEDESAVPVSEPARLLPTDVKFAITEMAEKTVEADDSSSDSADLSDEGDYDYELDNMSIDYHSFTNSDYAKVADDVKQFKDGEVVAVLDEPVLLITDDESGSNNSVLVIETNSLDAWDFSESEMVTEDTSKKGDQVAANSVLVEGADVEPVLENRAGFDIAKGEQYWLDDNEIISNNESVLFIKPERGMIYSSIEPGKWPDVLRESRKISKLPLPNTWRPKKGLVAYPISRLIWVNAYINDRDGLVDGLGDDTEFILERWPHFDLLELDNNLLKLCTMLFVTPESLSSLSVKSGYSRSTVAGLMNACHRDGILKKPSEVSFEQLSSASNDESMLGKIKDVFR